MQAQNRIGELNSLNFDVDEGNKIIDATKGKTITIYKDVKENEKKILGENPLIIGLEPNKELEEVEK